MEFPGPASALFGHTGLVGTTLRRTLKFEHCFNSQNLDEARGGVFSNVVFCSMPAVKWLANKEPEKDLQVLQQLKDALASITCDQFILISTIDVYQPPNSGLDESAATEALSNSALHPYGKHRALLEEFVCTQFSNHCIIRLPALFGLHLRKNYVYDLLHGNNVSAINRNSAFQWYDVSRLANDIQRVLKFEVQDINLFPEQLNTGNLIDMVASAGLLPDGLSIDNIGHNGAYTEYNICTKHSRLLGMAGASRYYCSADDVCAQFMHFLAEWAMMQRSTVSCIAWDVAKHKDALQLLKVQGVQYIELAPARFWDWEVLEAAHKAGQLSKLVADVVGSLKGHHIQVSSLQAVLYKKPQLCLFGTPEQLDKLADHMRLVIDLTSVLQDAGVVSKTGSIPIVFGAPKNRQRPATMSDQEADAVFVSMFKPLAEYALAHGCTICIEPNAPAYGCNYITTSSDAKRVVELVDHAGLRVHLDTGCMTMAGEDIAAGFKLCQGLIGHVHVSEPFLTHYLEPQVNHVGAVQALQSIGYDKLVSLELLAKNLDELAGSIAFYQQTYWPVFASK